MDANLPATRQIPGLSAERAAAAHDLLSWIESAPDSVSNRVMDRFWEDLCEDYFDLDDFVRFVAARMDDLGRAGLVWIDDNEAEWLHICEPID